MSTNRKVSISVNESQARLLLELLQLPQLTIPFPKAEDAASLYAEVIKAVNLYDAEANAPP